MANAGRGLGDAFLDRSWDRIAKVILLNVTGKNDLLHRSLRAMLGRGRGRILITGSIAGDVPSSYQAVYNATKAYVDILAWGIRNALKGDDVTVTCLMPGPTETPIFTREANDLAQTPIARSTKKDDPEKVARAGYKAMMKGERGVIPGWTNRIAAMLSGLLPQDLLAAVHRRGADPSR
jgi:short-subunit dehydrogenase